jgi:streptolysin S family bacteriocin protoxin
MQTQIETMDLSIEAVSETDSAEVVPAGSCCCCCWADEAEV